MTNSHLTCRSISRVQLRTRVRTLAWSHTTVKVYMVIGRSSGFSCVVGQIRIRVLVISWRNSVSVVKTGHVNRLVHHIYRRATSALAHANDTTYLSVNTEVMLLVSGDVTNVQFANQMLLLTRAS